MRYIRMVFHWPVVDAVFSALKLWYAYAILAGFARLGLIPGFLSGWLLTVVVSGYVQVLEWIFSKLEDAGFSTLLLAAFSLSTLPISIVLILWILDLLWLALSAPKQLLFGSLFSSEAIEARNVRHLDHIEKKVQ